MTDPPRSCLSCGLRRVDPDSHPDVRVCRECELERQSEEGGFLPGASATERAAAFIDGSGWRLAETMLDIPHQYTVRDLSTRGADRTTALGHASFEWFADLIRSRGVVKPWGRYRNTYLTFEGWEYWTMGFPIPETTIINRQAAGPDAADLMKALVERARCR